MFSVLRKGDLIAIAVFPESVPMRIGSALLEDILKEGGPLLSKNKPEQVKKVLKECVDYHSNPSNDKITAASAKIESVKDQMVENIELALARESKMENLIEKTDDLVFESSKMYHKSNKLKCMSLQRLILLIVILVLIVVTVGGTAAGIIIWQIIIRLPAPQPVAPPTPAKST